MLKVWYKKGTWHGIDGYYMSTEYSDARFYFGSLDESQTQFCRHHRIIYGGNGNSTMNIEWVEAKNDTI